ncbi:unnamed protein product, partial [Symbiodinium pilosum]
ELAQRFDFPHFKRVALVVVGEPPEAFKSKVHAVILAEKQEKMDAEWKARSAERERQKQIESLREKQRALEEAQRKSVEAAKAEGQTEGGEKSEVKDEEMKEEGAEVKEEAKEEADAQMKEEPKDEEAPPVAELDEEESRLWFLPRTCSDMVSVAFNSTFADFTLPDESENFSEIRYEWAGEVASKDYMKSWMQAKKITTRVEDLFPDESFTNRVLDWQRAQGEWQFRQKEFKADPVKQQAANTRMEKEKKYLHRLENPTPQEEPAEGEEKAKEEKAEGDDAEMEGFLI